MPRKEFINDVKLFSKTDDKLIFEDDMIIYNNNIIITVVDVHQYPLSSTMMVLMFNNTREIVFIDKRISQIIDNITTNEFNVCDIPDQIVNDIQEMQNYGFMYTGFYDIENSSVIYSSVKVDKVIKMELITQLQCTALNLDPKTFFVLIYFETQFKFVISKHPYISRENIRRAKNENYNDIVYPCQLTWMITNYLNNEFLKTTSKITILNAMKQTLKIISTLSCKCMICHRQIEEGFESLKPFVCDNPFCTFQYMELGLGPNIDDEIRNNPYVVDLLISLFYSNRTDPFPKNIGTYVFLNPKTVNVSRIDNNHVYFSDEEPDIQKGDIVCFEKNSFVVTQKFSNVHISVDFFITTKNTDRCLVKHRRWNEVSLDNVLEILNALPSITEMIESDNIRELCERNNMLCYPLLRWIICSNLSYIRHLTEDNEKIIGISDKCFQFKMVMDAPRKEKRFIKEKEKHSSMFAWHGSNFTNWHSIVRTGLNYDKISNGRAYGNGIYHAKDLSTSMGFSSSNKMIWPKSMIRPTHCVSLNEIIDAPDQFVSSNPYYVVQFVDWVTTRFFIVFSQYGDATNNLSIVKENYFKSQNIYIPKEIDKNITNEDVDDDEYYFDVGFIKRSTTSSPPPSMSSISATSSIQKELKKMVEYRNSISKRCWDFDPLNVSNIYCLTIFLNHFDVKLPLSKDMMVKGIYERGIELEIRFGPDFPMTPPFVRIVRPRLLQFMNGGGGHVTAGGSICMDLLTMSGWNPIYRMEAILIQIHLALSSIEPKPARLDGSNWDKPYSLNEAISSYIRVANDHKWTVPDKWGEYFLN